MTNPRMKLLPEKLTLDMRTAMYCAGPDFDKTYPAAVEHAPHAGQVSREQLDKAAEALFNSRVHTCDWKDAGPQFTTYFLEQARIAVRALGLSVEGEN